MLRAACREAGPEVTGAFDGAASAPGGSPMTRASLMVEITPRARDLVRVNCLRCHEGLVHAVAVSANGELDCLHCHSSAGHGAGG